MIRCRRRMTAFPSRQGTTKHLGYRPRYVLAALAVLLPLAAHASELTGPAKIVDGDTIDVVGKRIRLFGIDAPEAKQTCRDGSNVVYLCGQAAAKALREVVRGKDVRCEPRDVDRYRRVVAVCWAGGTNINERMVRDGWAVAYRQFSKEFVEAENEAHEAKRGLWAGTFVAPSEFRRIAR